MNRRLLRLLIPSLLLLTLGLPHQTFAKKKNSPTDIPEGYEAVQCHVGNAFMAIPPGWEIVQEVKTKREDTTAPGACHLVPEDEVDRVTVRSALGDLGGAAQIAGIHLYHFPNGASSGQAGVEQRLDPILAGALEKPRLHTDEKANEEQVSVFYAWLEGERQDGTQHIGMARVLITKETGSLWLVMIQEPEQGWSDGKKAISQAYSAIRFYETGN